MTEAVSIPLLATKRYIPPQRPNLVPRPRLAGRLKEALRLRHHLTLVSAKASTGKTMLVSEWLHAQERPAGVADEWLWAFGDGRGRRGDHLHRRRQPLDK